MPQTVFFHMAGVIRTSVQHHSTTTASQSAAPSMHAMSNDSVTMASSIPLNPVTNAFLLESLFLTVIIVTAYAGFVMHSGPQSEEFYIFLPLFFAVYAS